MLTEPICRALQAAVDALQQLTPPELDLALFGGMWSHSLHGRTLETRDRMSMKFENAEDGSKYLGRLLRHNRNPQFAQMVGDRDSVHREFGRLFHPENLLRLTAEEFKEFLLYEHNRHWWGIHRHQARLVSDMDRLRKGLGILLDESRATGQRLDYIEPGNGPKPIPGLGKAVFTPILHVAYPDKYGVWNSVAESAMVRLQLWPSFGWGWSFGDRYVAVNQVLQEVADQLDIDLWTLDSLWWLTELEHEPQKHQFGGGEGGGSATGKSARPARARDTFVCSSCFLTKSTNLRSSDPDICLDCNPESLDPSSSP